MVPNTTLDDNARKELAIQHCRRINARDVSGLLELYAENVRFEDPVGSGLQVGHQALRSHAASAIAAGVREAPGMPIAAPDERHVILPVVGVLPYAPTSPIVTSLGIRGPADGTGKVMRVDYMMTIQVGSSGLIEDMRSYWGRTDISVVEETEMLPLLSRAL